MVTGTDLVGDGEEPLPGDAPIVQTLLATENDVKTAPELVGRQSHDLVERILEE